MAKPFSEIVNSFFHSETWSRTRLNMLIKSTSQFMDNWMILEEIIIIVIYLDLTKVTSVEYDQNPRKKTNGSMRYLELHMSIGNGRTLVYLIIYYHTNIGKYI